MDKIDFTLLKPETTWKNISEVVHKVSVICVNPKFVRQLSKHNVKICSVIDFPLGASEISQKINQMVSTIEMGAHEVDVVMDAGMFIENPEQLRNDLNALCTIAHNYDVVIKIIVEACLWSTDQLCQLIKICADAGADYIKTSTGMNKLDTREHQLVRAKKLENWIELWNNERKLHGYQIKIKASGGITSRAQVEKLIRLGADRIGTSTYENY